MAWTDGLLWKGRDYSSQTTEPDWVFNDGGEIFFNDGVSTGWIQDPSKIKVYRDTSVVLNQKSSINLEKL